MQHTDRTNDQIAIIIADCAAQRSSHLLALEIDEKVTGLGFSSRIFDLADESYGLEVLERYTKIIVIGQHTGPLYSTDLHRLLLNQRNIWRSKEVAFIIDASEYLLAESANVQLKSVFKTLGVKDECESLIVVETMQKFDSFFNLMDLDLNRKMDHFLNNITQLPEATYSFAVSA